MKYIKKNIAFLMKERGLSVSDLSRMTDQSYNAIRRLIDTDSPRISVQKLEIIATALHVNIRTLFEEDLLLPISNLSTYPHLVELVQHITTNSYHESNQILLEKYFSEDCLFVSANYSNNYSHFSDENPPQCPHQSAIQEEHTKLWGMKWRDALAANVENSKNATLMTLRATSICCHDTHTVCANLNSVVEIGDQRETCEIINFLTLQKPVNYWPNRITRYWWYAPASSLQVLSNPKSPSL